MRNLDVEKWDGCLHIRSFGTSRTSIVKLHHYYLPSRCSALLFILIHLSSLIMSPQFPSIQSFFQPEISPTKKPAIANPPSECGDGFTAEEVEATLQPRLHSWQPRGSYENVEIGSLVPGPGCVALMGRVVNFYDQATPSKAPQAAKGCLKVIVKDDSGAIMVSHLPILHLLLLIHLGRSSCGTQKSITTCVSVSWYHFGHHTSQTRNRIL